MRIRKRAVAGVVLGAIWFGLIAVTMMQPKPAAGQNKFNFPVWARVKSTQPAVWIRNSNPSGSLLRVERVPTLAGTPGVIGTPTPAIIIDGDGVTSFNEAVQFNGSVTGGAVTNDLNGGAFYIDPNQSSILRGATNGLVTLTLPATGTMQITTGSFRVGNGSNGVTLNGEDAYVEGTFENDGGIYADGAIQAAGKVLVGPTPGSGTPTPAAGAAWFGSTIHSVGAVRSDGAVTSAGLTNSSYADITGRLMVGATPAATPVAGAGYIAGALALGSSISQPANTANGIGFSSVRTAAVITSTNGTLWTVPGSQKWLVQRVFCNVTENFACTGDDCTLKIGDDTDTDGFLTLADAELQAADTEGTGWPAGWQGFTAATVGAFLDGGGWGFPYVATQTVDIDIRDASDNSDPTGGAATCYLQYTRFE